MELSQHAYVKLRSSLSAFAPFECVLLPFTAEYTTVSPLTLRIHFPYLSRLYILIHVPYPGFNRQRCVQYLELKMKG